MSERVTTTPSTKLSASGGVVAAAWDGDSGRLRLLGWRARRGWLPRSSLWPLGPTHARDGHAARAYALSRPAPPPLSRIARVGLDLAYRNRGEAALVRVAYHGRAVASAALKGGALFAGAALVAAFMVPVIPGLLALAGVVAVEIALAAKAISILTDIPARATRALHVRRWSAPSVTKSAKGTKHARLTHDARSSGATDGKRIVVRGIITAMRTVPALDGRPAVFVRVRATRRGVGAELQKAEDFLLDDGTGTPTRVKVAHALFLDRPARAFGSWVSAPSEVFPLLPASGAPIDLEEAALHPGDEVEIVARSETVVDPTVVDRLARATPMVRLLTGTPEEPLLVRSVI